MNGYQRIGFYLSLEEISNAPRENFQCFVLEGAVQNLETWSGLKGQIYLGDKKFVSTKQNKIEKNVNDWSIPMKQKRPIAKTLLQIEKQCQDRNSAIVAAYNTGAYSQREIADYYNLHPGTVGDIVRKLKNPRLGTPIFRKIYLLFNNP